MGCTASVPTLVDSAKICKFFTFLGRNKRIKTITFLCSKKILTPSPFKDLKRDSKSQKKSLLRVWIYICARIAREQYRYGSKRHISLWIQLAFKARAPVSQLLAPCLPLSRKQTTLTEQITFRVFVTVFCTKKILNQKPESYFFRFFLAIFCKQKKNENLFIPESYLFGQGIWYHIRAARAPSFCLYFSK